jgi:hypothetical protein
MGPTGVVRSSLFYTVVNALSCLTWWWCFVGGWVCNLPGDSAPPPPLGLLCLRYCALRVRLMCLHRLRLYVLLSRCHSGASCNSRCVGFCVCSPLLAARVAQRRSSFCQINCMLMVWRVYVHFIYGMSRMHRWLGLGLCGFCSFTSRWLPSWLAG